MYQPKLSQSKSEVTEQINSVVELNTAPLVDELCNLLSDPADAFVFYRAIDRLKKRDVSTTAMEIIIAMFDMALADVPPELYLFNLNKQARIEFIDAFLEEFEFCVDVEIESEDNDNE